MENMIQTKECKKCGAVLPKTSEYFYKSGKGYMTSPCKDCIREYRARPTVRARMNESKLKYRRSQKAKIARRKYKASAKHKKAKRQYFLDNPHINRSGKKVYNAIRAGKIPHPTTLQCKRCDAQANIYHHWSYEREHWLDVIPLCHTCHVRLHVSINSASLITGTE